MKKLILFLFLLPSIVTPGNDYVIQDRTHIQSLGEYCYTYEDKSDTAGIYDVFNAEWEKPTKYRLNFGIAKHPHWLKINIRNSLEKEVKRYIYSPYHHIEYIDIFLVSSGKVVKRVKTGTARPYKNKTLLTPGYPIAFHLNSDENYQLFIRYDHRYLPLRAAVFILKEQQMMETITNFQGLRWFWKGVMFTTVVLSMVIFFFIRTRLFLYYAILLMGIIIFIGLEIGDYFQFFEIDKRNTIIDLKHFGNILVIFAFPMFVNQLTPVKKIHPLLWKGTMLLIVPFVLLFVAVTFNPVKETLLLYIITHYAIYVSAFIFFMQLLFLFSGMLKKLKNATLLFFIYLFYVSIFFITNSLPNLGLIDDTGVNVYGILLISSIMEVLTFMVLIARETFLIYRERTRLIEEQKNHQKNLLYATVEGQEKERNKIGRELHDMVGANLAVIKQRIQKENTELRSIISKTIDAIRNLSHGLITPQVNREEFADEISELCILMSTDEQSVKCFFYNWEAFSVNKEKTTHLYRIVQEILQNAIKHSHANKIHLQFSIENGELTIIYDDNGTGFNEKKRHKKGTGLLNIKNRVKILNGQWFVDANYPAKGTSMVFKIPL